MEDIQSAIFVAIAALLAGCSDPQPPHSGADDSGVFSDKLISFPISDE